MALPYGNNFIILTSTVFVEFTRVTDGQTDRRTGDSIYTRFSIYAVARKKYTDRKKLSFTKTSTSR